MKQLRTQADRDKAIDTAAEMFAEILVAHIDEAKSKEKEEANGE